jgi:hypothetical protein
VVLVQPVRIPEFKPEEASIYLAEIFCVSRLQSGQKIAVVRRRRAPVTLAEERRLLLDFQVPKSDETLIRRVIIVAASWNNYLSMSSTRLGHRSVAHRV